MHAANAGATWTTSTGTICTSSVLSTKAVAPSRHRHHLSLAAAIPRDAQKRSAVCCDRSKSLTNATHRSRVRRIPMRAERGRPGRVAEGHFGLVMPDGYVAAACTFVPPFLVVILLARFMRRASKNPSLKAFVGGVTASAAGAIAGAAYILGKQALVDVPTVLIAAVTFGALFIKKMPEPVLILLAGAVGMALKA